MRAYSATQSCPILVTPVGYNPPGSMGFPRQEYWSELPVPSPGTHTHIYIYIFFSIFFSVVVYPRILNTALCAIQ